ncbi:Ribosomal RNA large subunit methyltransferase G [Paraliobacillus sp. PM-2]|uniref:class I SAM-dependent methyltransferase n=1 Tax=Paraliobacillus sp. PM-2 TaxID=1462524 RepID=UPI00061C8CC1|nr:class I SAM-dependent methyltransferase [Paraliobacillus sp. PM-2]CQR48533.1 Ribosomal RNA large subunit methyltransferase G [Paraliobacillus sp. PM-2]
MSEQYFVNQPQSKSNPKTWTYELRGQTFQFTSDLGVFSKNEVDFGSKTLINAFQPPNIPGDIIDLGCGYGPIGLSIAKTFPERQVILSDINERALELAKGNAKQNQVKNVVFYIGDRLEAIPKRSYAAILINPPIRAGKQTVHQMFEESYDVLSVDGELWIVIQKKQGAPSAIKKLNEQFREVETVKKNKGYFIIKAKK